MNRYSVRQTVDLGGLTYPEYETMLGKQIFGKPGRMLLGIWISRLSVEEAQHFWGSQFSDYMTATKRGWAPQPGVDLDRFERMSMIEVVKIDRAKIYKRLPHPLWDIFRMLDSILSSMEDPDARRPFTMAPETMDKMVGDLQRIHTRTAPEPIPTSVGPETQPHAQSQASLSPTVVQSRGAQRGWPGNYRKRNGRGELQCSRCKKWKAPSLFSPRPNRPGLYKSQCKLCMAEVHRIRYLNLKKIEALNSVGLVFKVTEGDDVAELTCIGCGQPIEVGQEVSTHSRIEHADCSTI